MNLHVLLPAASASALRRPGALKSRGLLLAAMLCHLLASGCAVLNLGGDDEADGTASTEITAEEALQRDDDTDAPYLLGAGDRVRLTVFGHPDLSGEFEVDNVGRVALPLIRVVQAAGRTTAELASAIAARLQPEYLKDPYVSVDVVSYRPFYILGEVRNPGSYPYVTDMTVVAAVALAGGYTYRAARKKITVIRGSDADKKQKHVAEDELIRPGDVVEVPERFF